VAESLLEPENLKKIGWLASAIMAMGTLGAKFIPTKAALKKVDDDLQAHKVDDLKKHTERMDYLRQSHEAINGNVTSSGIAVMNRIEEYQRFVEGQINGIRQTVEKPFQGFVDLATDQAVLKIDLANVLAEVEKIKKEMGEKS
jgi:hypothetical protein